MDKKRGKIFVITGPSGVGKTEVAKNILKNKRLNLKRVITCTTRAPREGEKNGKDYFFLSKKVFLKNIQEEKMFEYAEVYGNYYGSRKKDVENLLKTGNNLLFVTDVFGAINLKKRDKNILGIFIKAESINNLKKRLLGRNTDSIEMINKRVTLALKELNLANYFDYEVTNITGKIDKAINEVTKIILGRSKNILLVQVYKKGKILK